MCVRNTQDQQTIGLPVGPDTSFILSEIIGAKIDQALIEISPSLVGIRYVDDFSLYLETRAEAEAAYSSLAKIAKQFELELNEGKTAIFEGPDVGQPSWKTVLHVFYVRKGRAQRASLLSFVQRSFELAQLYRNQGVLAYAVKKLSSVDCEDANADLFEAFLRAAMISDSDIIPTVLKVIFDRNAAGKLVYLDDLLKLLEDSLSSMPPQRTTMRLLGLFGVTEYLGDLYLPKCRSRFPVRIILSSLWWPWIAESKVLPTNSKRSSGNLQ